MLGPFKSNKKTGTTTAAYVEAVRVDTRGCGPQGKFIAIIRNTHATLTMKYKIDGYPNDSDGDQGGLAVAIKAETSIAAATSVTQTDVDKNYAAVVISVIDDSGHATYQIDWSTY
jgi:hypothetical protein